MTEEQIAEQTPKRNGRPKQLKIKGTERKDRNKRIEKAAASYVAVRDQRCELSKDETRLREALIHEMKEAKLTEYKCDDENLMVTLKVIEEKVKVKRLDEDTDDE